ncbi:MAG: S10 family peptidase [Bacteroidales bacterium]
MRYVGKFAWAALVATVLLGPGLVRAAVAQAPAQQEQAKPAQKPTPVKPAEQAVPPQRATEETAAPVKPADSRMPAAPPDSTTDNAIIVGGQKIAYRAVAGTITVGSTDAVDAMLALDGRWLPGSEMAATEASKPDEVSATARMFYAAYFKKDAAPETRPVMFFYNGGPGSSTMWLHMGSFGPRRVVTPDTEHKEAAPYPIIENQYSLLDVADLVFIDAPGTGFSRIMGKDKEKAFYGVDPDAHAFARFIRRFLTKHDRWNSPKYLFGESYGTPRSVVVAGMLLEDVDLNGIVLLSTILSFDNSVDGPHWNPGVDQAYAIALPTYAATAFYHKKLPKQPPALQPFLAEVETFALGDYMSALLQGAQLPDNRRQAIAEKLHDYTGLPVDYLLKADLRVDGGMFSKTLQDAEGQTTGRLDTRYQGPHFDPLSKSAEYDPQSAAISSAYTTAINQYLRTDLKFGRDWTYKPNAYSDANFTWDLKHRPPGGPPFIEGSTNVMPDLAIVMKANPKMRVLVAGGYYDLATPYFEGMFEMRHLPIARNLQQNISYKYYEAGHMVYVNEGVLKQFHDDLVAFVRATAAGK